MQQSPNKEKRYKGQGHEGSRGKPKFHVRDVDVSYEF